MTSDGAMIRVRSPGDVRPGHGRAEIVRLASWALRAATTCVAALGRSTTGAVTGTAPGVRRTSQTGRVRLGWVTGLLGWVVGFLGTRSLRSSPIPSISLTRVAPAFRYRLGSRPMPTPAGVPVKMMSPGSSGRIDDRYETRAGTEKMR